MLVRTKVIAKNIDLFVCKRHTINIPRYTINLLTRTNYIHFFSLKDFFGTTNLFFRNLTHILSNKLNRFCVSNKAENSLAFNMMFAGFSRKSFRVLKKSSKS